MRYIANKTKDGYIVSGIKTMKDLKGKEIEVIYATKQYDKEELEKTIEAYELELENVIEKYTNDLNDMKVILNAIEGAE